MQNLKNVNETAVPTKETEFPESSPLPISGYLFVALAALLWAISGSSAKFLFQGGMTPLQLVQVRVTLAAILLLLCLLACRRNLLRIAIKDIPYFTCLGIFGLAMVNFTYFLTISKIKVAAAILLEYLAPVFIALYAAVFARESITRGTILSTVGATLGCYLVVGGYNLDLLSMNRDGVICGILSAITFAWYSVYGEKGMRRYNPWTVLFYSVLFAALFWNVLHLIWNGAPRPFEPLRHSYSPLQWVLILYIATFGTILPFGLYLYGINLIRSTRASVTATLEPIIAGFISYLFLNEAFEPLQIVGGGIVIVSIVALQIRKEYDSKTPALIRRRATESF